MKIRTQQHYHEIFETARIYKEHYRQLQAAGFTGNFRKEIASRMGLSLPQADRYHTFTHLIPEVQQLLRDCSAGMSSLLIIASHSAEEQLELASLLSEACENGFRLTRPFVHHIVSHYRNGIRTWPKLQPLCSSFQQQPSSTKARSPHRPDPTALSEVESLSGREFELWFAELLRKNGFLGIQVSQHAWDKGADVFAQKDAVNYLFQCKKTSAGTAALQEIWFARQDCHHVPVVVTNGTFSASTRRLAADRGILLWDGVKLLRMLHSQAS